MYSSEVMANVVAESQSRPASLATSTALAILAADSTTVDMVIWIAMTRLSCSELQSLLGMLLCGHFNSSYRIIVKRFLKGI
jgi:hypothetical protein